MMMVGATFAIVESGAREVHSVIGSAADAINAVVELSTWYPCG
jgi:hypothetical protein